MRIESIGQFAALDHLPRFAFAFALLSVTLLRAATGFPEFSGFFSESQESGVYRSHGAPTPVLARSGEVSFGGVVLEHDGASVVTPIPIDPTPALVNTYTDGRSEISQRTYRAIEYRDLYPGVTLRLSFHGRAVKADYVVAGGADVRQIKFRFRGLQARIEAGDLIAGTLRQPAPVISQAGQKPVGRYRIGRDGWVRFVIRRHDPQASLTIDPYVVNSSAYVGGGMADFIAGMAVDPAGYMYITGSTESTDFPSSPLRARALGAEVYVMKIDPATQQVVYATYLGGNAEDRALAIAVDSSGDTFVAGFTTSLDFPGGPVYGGGARDGFIARLNASGALQFATFLGGSGSDTVNGIALKNDGSVWVAGETTSMDMPLVGVPYQAFNRGSQDVFLARVNASGAVAYTTYFGGTGDDRAVGIALDPSSEVYFTGATTSTNFPAANAFRNFNAGLQDAFVAKLSADGSALRYSTYLGGSGGSAGQNEVGNWVGVNSNGEAYIVGITPSANFPVTSSAIQPTSGGGTTDAFIAKLGVAGTTLLYSTYYGGSSTDEGWVGALSVDGTFYFGGNTSSPEMLGIDAFQSEAGGDLDGFFGKLTSDLGTRLAFNYLGYTGQDSLTGMAVTASNIYLAGSSASPTWLPSGGFKGIYDGWIMKVTENPLSIAINSAVSAALTVSGAGCSPASLTAPGTLSWKNGATCVVSFSGSQGSGPTRAVFQSWADGGSANPRTFVASSFTPSYTMQWGSEHLLTGTVSPVGGGSITGANTYYAAGSTAQLTAAASTGYQFGGWSGSASGTSTPISVLMDAPKTVTASFNALVSFTSTPAVQITTAGTGCAAGVYTTPVTLAWTPGATCIVSSSSTQVVGDSRWTFSKWADGPATNPRSIVATAGATYALQWNTEYRLTRTISPAEAGAVSGADGFYPAGTNLTLSATAATGYQFSHWSGDAAGATTPVNVAMSAPRTVTANFLARTAAVTIDSTLPSMQFSTIGAGCNPGTYYTPQTFTWNEGTVCSISAPATQGGDVRWLFNGWTDNSSSNPRPVTVVSPSSSYTMRFDTQYKLTRQVSGQGSVTGADGYYAAGSSIQLTATPASGNQFTGWSGNIVSSVNPLTFTLNSPSTITANFSAAPTGVSIGANIPGQFTMSGSGCPLGTYTAPTNLIWTNGASCRVTIPTPQGGPDTRLVSSGWTDSSDNPRDLIASPGASYTLAFTYEHKVTRSAIGQGTVSGADGYYAPGSILQFTAAPAPGYSFVGWSGSVSGVANPITVNVDGPKTITANFLAGAVGVRIESAIAAQFTMSGTNCPAGTYTTPVTLSWITGAGCDVSVISPQGGPDSRWVFSNWADGPVTPSRTLIASAGAVYTINWGLEHRLTRIANGGGSVSGADGFYPEGSPLQLTAIASGGYQFTGWSGAAGGTANPISIIMDGPKSVTATFVAIPTGVRIESAVGLTFTVSGAGCPAGAYSAPTTLTWTTGNGCNVSVLVPPATADTKYAFSKWSDGNTNNPRAITASSGAVYTVVLATEYKLTRAVSGSGSIDGADGFYPGGSWMQLTATPAPGYQFNGWSGAASGSANPLTFVMDAPKGITANFSPAVSGVRIESNVPAQFTLAGVGCPGGVFTTPITVSWATGSNCNASVPSPQGGDVRRVFVRWSDGSTSNSRPLTALPNAGYALNFDTEYRLIRGVSGGGTVSGADGFYPAGQPMQVAASPAPGYQFSGWSGSAGGAANPLTFVMDAPKSITANFLSTVASVRIDANIAGQFSVSGPGCPAGSYTAPVALAWMNGASCTITAIDSQGPDTRSLFARWTDGSTANPRAVVGSAGAVYGLIFETQYRLTRTVSGPGSVSGVDGFYGAGSNVELTATPADGYFLKNWSGTTGGSTNPVTIRMDGPTLMTANFAQGIGVDAVEPLNGSGGSGTFTATFSHGRGVDQHYLGYILFLPTPNIVWYTAKGSCLIEYNRFSNGIRLINDAGDNWLGPLSGVVISPIAGTLTNRQCTVNIAGTKAVSSGNTVTVTVPVVFHSGMTPIVTTFLQAFDVNGRFTGMTQFGNWIPAISTPIAGPSIVSATASASAGSSVVYTMNVAHTSGASTVSMITLLVSTAIVGGLPCQVVYYPGNQTLNLVNDSGSGLVHESGIRAGTPGAVANSRCSINTGAASQVMVGSRNLLVTVPLNFQPSTFAGQKKVYVNAFDAYGLLTHWVQFATMNVQ